MLSSLGVMVAQWSIYSHVNYQEQQRQLQPGQARVPVRLTDCIVVCHAASVVQHHCSDRSRAVKGIADLEGAAIGRNGGRGCGDARQVALEQVGRVVHFHPAVTQPVAHVSGAVV